MALAREMARSGVVGVSFTGGEVLLREDLGKLIEVLADGGLTVRVTTNGSLVGERIDRLRRASVVKMSLDGPPDLHDSLRDAGAFDAIRDAVDRLTHEGIPVQVNSVLTKMLLERLDEHLEHVRRLGTRVTFQVPEDRPGAKDGAIDDIAPDPAALRRGLAILADLASAGDRRIGNSRGTLEYMRSWPEIDPVDCFAGRFFCRVLPDGRVVACDRDYAPTPIPPPGTRDGFVESVKGMRRAGRCRGCFRNNTIEINRALGGGRDALVRLHRLL
jgi:MoaA/NifB/PqqE/SkfB family radical SAM enzyme